MSTDRQSRFRRIESRMWGDQKFQALSPMPVSGQGLWIWLLTGPAINPIPGILHIGPAAISEHLGWEVNDTHAALQEIVDQRMVVVDKTHRIIWVPKAIYRNRPANQNIVRSWASTWADLPECAIKATIWLKLKSHMESFGPAFLEAFLNTCPQPTVAPSDEFSTQGALFDEQEVKPAQSKLEAQQNLLGIGMPENPNPEVVEKMPKSSTRRREAIMFLFAHWQASTGSIRAKLSDDRTKAINTALGWGYSTEDLAAAIDGCMWTPHNRGYNDRSTRQKLAAYTSLELIFRSGEQIERFMGNRSTPPSIPSCYSHLADAIGPLGPKSSSGSAPSDAETPSGFSAPTQLRAVKDKPSAYGAPVPEDGYNFD